MAFDINITNMLILILTNLNTTLVEKDQKNKILSYSTFSKRENENVNDFVNDLKKTFLMNRILNRRKHIVAISCLKDIIANYYNSLNGITN